MKTLKYSILICLGILYSSPLFSQIKYNNWAVGINNGLAMHYGDGLMDKPVMSMAVNGKYSFTNRFSLRAGLGYLGISAKNLDFPTGMNTSITKAFDLNTQMVFNIANFSRRNNGNAEIFSNIYFTAGGGYLRASIEYSKPNIALVSHVNTTYSLWGFGYKTKISKLIDIYAEYSQLSTNTDDLEGYSPDAVSNHDRDVVGIPRIGLQIKIGDGVKNVEWTTLQEYNDRFKSTKKKE